MDCQARWKLFWLRVICWLDRNARSLTWYSSIIYVGLLFSPQCAEWIMTEVLIEGFLFFFAFTTREDALEDGLCWIERKFLMMIQSVMTEVQLLELISTEVFIFFRLHNNEIGWVEVDAMEKVRWIWGVSTKGFMIHGWDIVGVMEVGLELIYARYYRNESLEIYGSVL